MLAETSCILYLWHTYGMAAASFCHTIGWADMSSADTCGAARAIMLSAQHKQILQPSRGQPGLPASSVERTSVTITIMAWQDMQAAIIRLAGAVTEVSSADSCGRAGVAMPSWPVRPLQACKALVALPNECLVLQSDAV